MRVPTLIREPLLALARRLGYGVYRINTEGALYGPVMPAADYSPWNADAAFQRCMAAIRGHTLVDICRCHELGGLSPHDASAS